MIPETNISDYREFTHKLILTSIGTIVLSSALTQVVTTMVIPATAQYIPAWSLPLVEAVAASYVLYHANKNSKPKEKDTPTIVVPPVVEELPPAPMPGGRLVYSQIPPSELENVFMPKAK